LLHALPSTLARAEGRVDAELLRHERAELAAFDCALVTSATAAEALAQLAPHLPAWVVEPAIFAAPPGLRGTSDPVRALVVANLTPNKGVLPWLGALAPRVRADDVFSLRHMGRLDLDPGYAEACLHKVRSTPALASRVAFDGVKTHAALLAELARAHVLISASRVESFGMAIADARASGCVVLARAGGHVERLVTVQAGGSVLGEDDALADTFLSCVRDRASLQERLRRASAQRLAARSWHEVAREFTRYLAASAWP
jgi:glycosyltransferase involved in cell wall biosynthesis